MYRYGEPQPEPYRSFEAYRILRNAACHVLYRKPTECNVDVLTHSLLMTRALTIAAKFEVVPYEETA